MYWDMKQSSKWLTEDATESSLGGTGLELTFWGKFICRGFHGLLQWPETTCFHAAPTATLHTPHLQRSASTGETCTIFNWPSKHTGRQGFSPFVILILYFCAVIFFNVPLVFFSFLILLPTRFFDLSDIFFNNQINANVLEPNWSQLFCWTHEG